MDFAIPTQLNGNYETRESVRPPGARTQRGKFWRLACALRVTYIHRVGVAPTEVLSNWVTASSDPLSAYRWLSASILTVDMLRYVNDFREKLNDF